jgi:hypothetical protein
MRVRQSLLPVLPRTHAEGSWLGQIFSDREVILQAHRAPCYVHLRRALYFIRTSRLLNTEPLRKKSVSITAKCSENLRTRTWLDVWTLATKSPSLHAIHLLPDPDRCHYLALKRLCKYLRHTINWGILYWRQAPCDLLPAGDFKILAIDIRDLHEFPKFSSLLELAGYVRTSRSVTDLSFCFAGVAIAFKSKLQPTVATSSTESE